jgi:hypothetical protein
MKIAEGLVQVKVLGARRPLWEIRLFEVPNVHALIALVAYVRKYAP